MESMVSQLLQEVADVMVTALRPPQDVRREIRRLQNTLEMISAILADAEKLRLQDKTIDIWSKELKEVMYDADDFMDLYSGELRNPSLDQRARNRPVCCSGLSPFPIFTRAARRHEIALRIREINTRLEVIAKDRVRYQLRSLDLKHQDEPLIHRRTSPILTSDVVGVGIEEDTRVLVSLLLQQQQQQQQPKSRQQVLAITGMGGIGKTTLAQKIYNDLSIQEHFDTRIWVLVSQHFSETDLLRGIISYVGGSHNSATTRQQLEEILSRMLSGRRFFLVLDDMWAVDVWDHVLRNPLQSGDPGSRIIVTTRNEGVPRQMGAVLIHRVELLSEEDSWSLFCKLVFVDDDKNEMERLRDPGLEIVKKCGGLPLALNSVGRILRSRERSYREWRKVIEYLKDSRVGFVGEYMPALCLSYQALPSKLKPCFLYCSLLPENRVMFRRDLMQMWISEGYIDPHSDSPEDLAEDYYAEIAARALLKSEPEDLDDLGMDQGYRIHDLIRDLAINLAQDDNYTGDIGELQNKTTRLRRISIIGSINTEPITASAPTIIASHFKGLRALLIFDNPMSVDMLRDLLGQFKHLRVLDLRGATIVKVPENIGELFHLRYLNLSRTGIQCLPSTIRKLGNLLFLNLSGCMLLRNLPQGITDCHNLRSLNLLHTDLDDIPPKISEMGHLNTLLGFVVGNCRLEELKLLDQLRYLSIRKLERTSAVRALILEDKHHLRSLVLSWSVDRIHGVSTYMVNNILEDLQPPSCLEKLTIKCYPADAYPKWMLSPSIYTNLEVLNLKSCTFCESLPPLGQLPQLKNLHISDFPRVVTIGTEFFGMETGIPFPKLEKLVIEEMDNWEEWSDREGGALPSLREMNLKKCTKLRYLPRCLQFSTTLTKLVIEAADSIREIEDLLSVTELRLKDCPNLERISHLTALKTMKITRCPILEEVGDLEALHHLVLVDFALESLPEWLAGSKSTMSLDTLNITGNHDLLRSLQVDGPGWHKIATIPHVYIHSAHKSI